jgi:catechol 2,3-dioxygenase-like lactoylglutathione lyase family enzyme
MPPVRIEHVLVLAADMDVSRDFYRDAIGLTVGPRPPLAFPGHWLYAGDVAVIHVAARGPYAEHAATLGAEVSRSADGRGPIDHVALAADDHDEVLGRLDALGLAYLQNEIPGVGIRQVFVEDPDGVRVEINVAPA